MSDPFGCARFGPKFGTQIPCPQCGATLCGDFEIEFPDPDIALFKPNDGQLVCESCRAIWKPNLDAANGHYDATVSIVLGAQSSIDIRVLRVDRESPTS